MPHPPTHEMDARILCLIALVCCAGASSAAPFTLHATVNGVDPTEDVASVKPGETVDVHVTVDVESGDVLVYDVVFKSSPAVMGDVLNDFVGEEGQFPKRLGDGAYSESYDLPGVMPAGEYNLVAKVYYTGAEEGVVDYEGRVRVESTGFVSVVLGLLVRVLPGFASKPLLGLFI